MTLRLSIWERLARARAELRLGAVVALVGGEAGALVGAAETLAQPRLDALRAVGPTDLAVTRRRAETLKARAYDGDLARLSLDGDFDLRRVRAVADPAGDLASPMKGPFASRRGGEIALHRAALRLAKKAHLLPAAVVTPLTRAEAEARAEADSLSLIDVADWDAAEAEAIALAPVSDARVPLMGAEGARVRVFRPADGSEEHYAVEIGAPDRALPVLARLHSACFTGDVLGSLKCDCGPQLHAALAAMAAAGGGVLMYLNQEGRGIGLANKMRAYSLQDQGFDTVDANHRLGFEDDERDFRLGATLLRRMGFDSVRLMTNNPRKVAMMEAAGLAVTERVPLIAGENPLNARYLATKAKRSGHLL